jgi:glycosyltransferase involved in cell wall biosynthesis
MIYISIVSPVYQGAGIIPRLVAEISTAIKSITDSFEIILIDDRSSDNSWEEIKQECIKSNNVKGIRLSRNFGQHSAITAGLNVAIGDWIVVMDCDLQDRPDQIPTLYSKATEGYEIVFARRRARKDSKLKMFYSRAFYSAFSYLTGTHQDPAIANFGIYHKKVIGALLDMGDNIRYFPTMVRWVGFRSTSVDVEHSPRAQGQSTYSLKKLLLLAANNIICFSDKPLRLVAQSGLLISLVSVCIGLLYLAGYLLGVIKVAGYTSLIISIWLTAGINVFVLGLVGIYVGKAFEKIKGRQIYIIDEELNNA